MESVPRPHHLATRRPDRLTRLCREAGVDPAIGLAADLLPLNKGVLLLIGRTRDDQRRMWVERAGIPLDPSTAPSTVEMPAEFRKRLGMTGRPVALDRYAIKELWLIESATEAAEVLESMLRSMKAIRGTAADPVASTSKLVLRPSRNQVAEATWPG
jgi:hypothetical protein